jgi:endoglucanase
VISIPCRYIHSPSAYLNRDDYENTLRLLKVVLSDLTFDAIKQD